MDPVNNGMVFLPNSCTVTETVLAADKFGAMPPMPLDMLLVVSLVQINAK